MTAPDAIDRLHGALDALAGALATGRPQAVLDAEGALGEAVRALDAGIRTDAIVPDHLRPRLDRVRHLVARCRALGAASAGLADAMFPRPGYGRSGRPVQATLPASTMPRSVR